MDPCHSWTFFLRSKKITDKFFEPFCCRRCYRGKQDRDFAKSWRVLLWDELPSWLLVVCECLREREREREGCNVKMEKWEWKWRKLLRRRNLWRESKISSETYSGRSVRVLWREMITHAHTHNEKETGVYICATMCVLVHWKDKPKKEKIWEM